MKKFYYVLILAISVALLQYVGLSQISKEDDNSCCLFWQSKIDTTLGNSKTYEDVSNLRDEEVIFAIECLLKLEGNKNKASFSGAINPNVSSVPQFTPAEVSGLYYISYLYYQKFDHASAVALDDGSGELNSTNVIKEAYKSYRKWFIEIKKIGLKEAREKKLDPLAYTEVEWY